MTERKLDIISSRLRVKHQHIERFIRKIFGLRANGHPLAVKNNPTPPDTSRRKRTSRLEKLSLFCLQTDVSPDIPIQEKVFNRALFGATVGPERTYSGSSLPILYLMRHHTSEGNSKVPTHSARPWERGATFQRFKTRWSTCSHTTMLISIYPCNR